MKIDVVSFLKSLTILIPLAIVLFRYRKIEKSYYPFLFYLLVGSITEIVTFVFFVIPKKSNAPISNLYVLVEYFLIIWLFVNWGFFQKPKKLLLSVSVILTLVWITESILFGKFATEFIPFYRILYHFVLVLLSVNIINYTIINDSKNLLRNSVFLICLSFTIFFVYKLIYEGAYQYSISSGHQGPRNTIVAAFGFVNGFQKLLCAVAAWFIPERKEFLNRASYT